MISSNQQRYKRYALLPKLRKWTTPVHWLYGGLSAFLILSHGIFAGWLAMGAFALWEYWNDKEEKARNPTYLPSGCADWWEAFFVFTFGYGILAILNYIGIVTIGWF